jgi:hypothetical protein
MSEEVDQHASSSIHRKTQPNTEVVRRLESVYLATVSRLSKQTILEPLIRENKFNGTDFTPIVPDNSPPGTILTLKRFDTISGKPVAEIYEVVNTAEGKIVVKMADISAFIKKTVDREVTGESLGPYDPPVTLPTLDVGDNLEHKNLSGTAFQSINQPRRQSGDDYFSVAIATPNRLRRFAR